MAIGDLVRGVNLGDEFDQGVQTPNAITLKLGAGLTKNAAGVISVTLATTVVQRCLPVGWINVNANGSVAAECGGAGATRTGVGFYTLTPPTGAATVQLHVVEDATNRDDIVIHATNFVGSSVWIAEQDNGGTAGTPRDRAFSAVWLGAAQPVVTNVAVL